MPMTYAAAATHVVVLANLVSQKLAAVEPIFMDEIDDDRGRAQVVAELTTAAAILIADQTTEEASLDE